MTPPPQLAARARTAPVDKREAIMTAALELFVERGFFGTAVPEVAERANVGAGTIYRYFESKEALVNAIYRDQKLKMTSALLTGFPLNAPAREQFRTIWSRMARFVDENPKGFAFCELHHHASYLDAESLAVEQRMIDLVVRFLEVSQTRGEIRAAPPFLLIGLIMGAFIGVVRWATESGLVLTPEVWAQAEQCAWESVRS
jgi:TetR/AcrR family transcriptional regulator, repressor of fatR-cypB operon